MLSNIRGNLKSLSNFVVELNANLVIAAQAAQQRFDSPREAKK
jgi:hypothetical protein